MFAYEVYLKADARIGFLTAIRKRGNKVRLEYKLWEDLSPIPASKLAELRWELDIGEWEQNRTHWAVKAIDLIQVLVEAGLIQRDQAQKLPERFVKTIGTATPNHMVVAPTVFSVADLPREADLVSVMMPFQAEFDPVYAAIQLACKRAKLRCLRADDVWQDSVVIQDIFNLLLVRCSVVVVDFSFRNPNVMYETGIAHILGRPVVPISQSAADVPFDLRHHRFLKYYPNGEGLADLEAKLTERLKTLAVK